jgi:hypothetical protein
MTFEDFQSTVDEMMAEIPSEFTRELQAVHVLPQARPEAGLDQVWRLGEYLDPGPEAFLGSNSGLGRHIALYYGSFVRIAAGRPEFDWDTAIWDTLTHELRHHVESLAGDVSLIAEDTRRRKFFEQRQQRHGRRPSKTSG